MTKKPFRTEGILGTHGTRKKTSYDALIPSKMNKGREWTTSWKQRYEELIKYRATNGDCLVPTNYPPNKKLGYWVMTQRRQYTLLNRGKPSTLCEVKITMLENLGFAWKIREKNSTPWTLRLKELQDYKAVYGDCMVPQRFHPNPALGTWVNTQRRHYRLMKQGKKSIMTPERVEALEKLGFVWGPRKSVARSPSNHEGTSQGAERNNKNSQRESCHVGSATANSIQLDLNKVCSLFSFSDKNPGVDPTQFLLDGLLKPENCGNNVVGGFGDNFEFVW